MFNFWADSDNGSTLVLHIGSWGSIPHRSTKIYPARLLARSIPFQGIGTGSIPVQDAKVYIPLVLTAARQSPKLLVGVQIPRGMPFLSLIGLAAMPPCLERGNRRFESFMGDHFYSRIV